MILRDDRYTALDNVIEKSRRMAYQYREAAKIVDDYHTSEIFTSISRRRENLADKLDSHLRKIGGLPSKPDPDRETIDELITWAKSLWVHDKRKELLAEARKGEGELNNLINRALEDALPLESRDFLMKAQREISSTLRQLTIEIGELIKD